MMTGRARAFGLLPPHIILDARLAVERSERPPLTPLVGLGRMALHKDDTLDNRNGSSDLPIYFCHSSRVLAIFLRAVDRFVDRNPGGRSSGYASDDRVAEANTSLGRR